MEMNILDIKGKVDSGAKLSAEEIKAIEDECEDVTTWLRSNKECSCVDFRGEDPACRTCQAAELIDLLFDLVRRGAA